MQAERCKDRGGCVWRKRYCPARACIGLVAVCRPVWPASKRQSREQKTNKRAGRLPTSDRDRHYFALLFALVVMMREPRSLSSVLLVRKWHSEGLLLQFFFHVCSSSPCTRLHGHGTAAIRPTEIIRGTRRNVLSRYQLNAGWKH